MKITPGNANPHVGTAHNSAFDAEVERIDAMTVLEVESNLRLIGIEPAKTLPSRLSNFLAKKRRSAANAKSDSLEEAAGIPLYSVIIMVGIIAVFTFILAKSASLWSEITGLPAGTVMLVPPCILGAVILFKSLASTGKHILISGLAGITLIVLFSYPVRLIIPFFHSSEADKCCQSIVIVDTSVSQSEVSIKLLSKKMKWIYATQRENERLVRDRERLLKVIDSELRATELISLSACQSGTLEVWETANPQPNVLATYQSATRERTLGLRGNIAREKERREFFENLTRGLDKRPASKSPASSSDISNVYAALERATEMDSNEWRKLVVITDSRETSDPLIRKAFNGTWVSGNRINNERTRIVFYDLGLPLGSQYRNMQKIWSSLFTHPETISVKSEF